MRQLDSTLEPKLREPKDPRSRRRLFQKWLLLGALAAMVTMPGCGAADDGFLGDDGDIADSEDAIIAGTNLALNKPTTSSSVGFGGVSSRAVDGNTNGIWANASIAHTNSEVRPWFQVDLQASQFVGTVALWSRTDCCSDQLSNFKLRVSDDLVNWQDFNFAGAVVNQASFAINRTARYVRVELNGDSPRYLALAEMQVFAPPNLAQGKNATQSSVYAGGVASRAVDGNANGSYANSSVTHTNFEAQAWWQVDLGAMHNVGIVELYNRTDCCSERLSNFKLLVSNDGSNWSTFNYGSQAPAVLPFTVNRSARYVKVQLNGTNALSLAEVRVYPMSNAATINTGAGSLPLVGQPTTPIGEIEGKFSVDAQGAATYSIPLQAPPGIHGLTPKLSLGYRSGGGNGMLGVGWSLNGLPSISRCPKTQAQDGVRGSVNGDVNDRFCLDGQRLVAIAGAYGASGTEYRTELNTFTRVRSFGSCGTGPCRFEVTDKTGNTAYLGNTNAVATYNDNQTLRSWSLQKMQDTNGNYMDVLYSTQGEQLYPSSIQYTKHDSAPMLKLRRISFEYEGRPDIESGYTVGKKITTGQRISAIKTFVATTQGDELVRQYRLTYQTSGLTKRSLLAAVTECDALGVCLPATSFQYNSNGAGVDKFDINEPTGTGLYNYQHRMRFDPGAFLSLADFSGDGRTDLLRIEKGGWQSDYAGNFSVYTATSTPHIFSAYEYPASAGMAFYELMQGEHIEIYPTDYNGDGRMDFIRREKNVLDNDTVNTFGVYVSKPTGGFDAYYPGSPVPGDPYQEQMSGDGGVIIITGDFNGDGRGDFLRQQRDYWADNWPANMFNVYFSTGINGQYNIVTPQGPLYTALNGKHVDIIPGDFNGDGKTDFLRREKGAGNNDYSHSFDVFYSNGDGTFTIYTPGQPVQFDIYQDHLRSNLWFGQPVCIACNGQVRIIPGDFNGDGKTDFIRQATGGWSLVDPANTFSVYFSKGVNGEFEKVTPTGSDYHGEAFNGETVEIIPMDYNGDGKTDFIRREFGERADDNWYTFGLYISKGDGTFEVMYPGTNGSAADIYQGNSATDQAFVFPADLDGDGKSDFIRQEFGTAANDDLRTFQTFLANGDDAGDYLKNVTTGIGNSVDVDYGGLNDPAVHTRATTAAFPTNIAVSNAMNVVKSTTVSEENAPSGDTYNYTYNGALINTEGRGFLGFASIKEVGPLATRETLYHQDFPLTGSIKESRQLPNVASPASLITTYQYQATQSQPGVHVVVPISESTTHTEPSSNSSTSFTTEKAYVYDEYANVVIVRDLGLAGDPRDDVDTCTVWLNNASAWHLAYPAYTRVADSCQYSSGSCNCTGVKKFVDRYYGSGANVSEVWEFEHQSYTWHPTTFTYDLHGNMLTKSSWGINNSGPGSLIDEVTTYDADYRTFPISQSRISAPLGLTTTFTYDPRFGTLAAQTDPNGNTVTNQFDGLGRLTIASATSPAGIVTPVMRVAWGANSKGSYKQVFQRNSWTSDDWSWERTYVDGRGRAYRTEAQTLVETQPVVVNREFDAFGEIKKETIPFYDDNNAATPDPTTGLTFTRDWLGRIAQVQDSLGHSTNVQYAVNRNTCDLCVVSVTTMEGVGTSSSRVSTRFVDVEGNVLRQVDGDNRVSSFTYDKLGRRTHTTDALGTTVQAYDSFDRVVMSTSPDRGTTTNVYGYRTGWLSSSSDGNGQITQYNYDTLGRLTEKVVVGKQSVSFDYDEPAQPNSIGRMTSARVFPAGQAVATSKHKFGYTPDGRISSDVITIDGNTYQTSSSYDPRGRLRSFTYPDGTVLDRTYNAQGVLSKLSIGTTEYARYENFTPSGQPGKVTYANGNIREHSYDAASRLSTAKTTAGATTLLDYAYSWDSLHRITSIQDRRDASRTQSFLYSPGGQLMSATGIYGSLNYSYDAVGNLTSKEGASFGYAGHRVVSGPNGFAATYDAAGNRTGQTRDGVAWTYEYDGENRIQRVVKGTNNDEVNRFQYDALGERIKKVDDNLTTTYYLTPNYEIAILPDSRQITTKYISDSTGRVASIVTDSGSQSQLMFDLQTLDRMKDHYNLRSVAGVRAYAENRLQALWLRPWVQSLAKTSATFVLALAAMALGRKLLGSRWAQVQKSLRDFVNPPATSYARRHPLFALATPLVMASFLAACQPIGQENLGQAEQALDPGANGWGIPTAGTYYFHNNHLSSSSLVTNAQGVEVARTEYKPYGEIVQSASPGTDMFRSKFTGKEWDRDSQLYDFHARAYDPFTGRFMTADAELVGGPEKNATVLNPYAYANNNPIVYSDPSGHYTAAVVIPIVIGIIVGAYLGGMAANGTANPAAWNWNSWSTYVGIAAGAAIGGVSCGAGTTIGGLGGAVFASAAQSIVISGLQFLSPRGYSLENFGVDVAIGIATGAAMWKVTPIMKAKASALWQKLTTSAAEEAAEAAAAKATSTVASSLTPKLSSQIGDVSEAIVKGIWKVGTRIGSDQARTHLLEPGATNGVSPRAAEPALSTRADGNETNGLLRSMVDAMAGASGASAVAGRTTVDWSARGQQGSSGAACRAPEAFGGFAVAF